MRAPGHRWGIIVVAAVVMAGAYAAFAVSGSAKDEDLIWLLPYESGAP